MEDASSILRELMKTLEPGCDNSFEPEEEELELDSLPPTSVNGIKMEAMVEEYEVDDDVLRAELDFLVQQMEQEEEKKKKRRQPWEMPRDWRKPLPSSSEPKKPRPPVEVMEKPRIFHDPEDTVKELFKSHTNGNSISKPKLKNFRMPQRNAQDTRREYWNKMKQAQKKKKLLDDSLLTEIPRSSATLDPLQMRTMEDVYPYSEESQKLFFVPYDAGLEKEFQRMGENSSSWSQHIDLEQDMKDYRKTLVNQKITVNGVQRYMTESEKDAWVKQEKKRILNKQNQGNTRFRETAALITLANHLPDPDSFHKREIKSIKMSLSLYATTTIRDHRQVIDGLVKYIKDNGLEVPEKETLLSSGIKPVAL